MSINRNRQDDNGNTIIHMIVMEDRYVALEEIVRQYFLKYPTGQADLAALFNKRNYDDRGGGRTALHYACSAKSVQLCVRHGAEVDARDTFGLTPLHIYILENRLCCVKAILALNASINIRAAKNKRCKMRKGRKVSLSRDSVLNGSLGLYNRSSVMLAAQCANYDILLMLLSYSPRRVLSHALASIGISDRESCTDMNGTDLDKAAGPPTGVGGEDTYLKEQGGTRGSDDSLPTSTSFSPLQEEKEARPPMPEYYFSPSKSPPLLDPREHTDSEGNTCLHLVCAATSHTLSETDRQRILLPERRVTADPAPSATFREEGTSSQVPRLQSIVREHASQQHNQDSSLLLLSPIDDSSGTSHQRAAALEDLGRSAREAQRQHLQQSIDSLLEISADERARIESEKRHKDFANNLKKCVLLLLERGGACSQSGAGKSPAAGVLARNSRGVTPLHLLCANELLNAYVYPVGDMDISLNAGSSRGLDDAFNQDAGARRMRHRSSLLEDDHGKVTYISGFAEPLLQIFLDLGGSNSRGKVAGAKQRKKKNQKSKWSLRKHPVDAVNIADNDGATPLLIAVANRQWGLARMLLEAGADLNLYCPSSSPFLSDSGQTSDAWPLLAEDEEANVALPDIMVTASELMPKRLRRHFFSFISMEQTRAVPETISYNGNEASPVSLSHCMECGKRNATSMVHCSHCRRFLCISCANSLIPVHEGSLEGSPIGAVVDKVTKEAFVPSFLVEGMLMTAEPREISLNMPPSTPLAEKDVMGKLYCVRLCTVCVQLFDLLHAPSPSNPGESSPKKRERALRMSNDGEQAARRISEDSTSGANLEAEEQRRRLVNARAVRRLRERARSRAAQSHDETYTTSPSFPPPPLSPDRVVWGHNMASKGGLADILDRSPSRSPFRSPAKDVRAKPPTSPIHDKCPRSTPAASSDKRTWRNWLENLAGLSSNEEYGKKAAIEREVPLPPLSRGQSLLEEEWTNV